MSALNLTSKSFNLANARELALYARMAYDEPPTICNAATDTQVLIRDLGDCIVISVRGTSNLRDGITDAEAWRMETTNGGIHYGGYRAYTSIHAELVRALNLMTPDRQRLIVLTGHSLGGMLDFIAAKVLRDLFFRVHSVYTFGAPRVGDRKFQTEYNATPMPGSPFDNLGDATFTLIHDCDIVPRVPGWLAGFRRPGHDEFISGVSQDIWEDPSVPLRLGSDLYSIGKAWLAKHGWLALSQIVTDHCMDNYSKALAAASEAPALPLNDEPK